MKRYTQGFSLVEIMVVVVILGLTATFVTFGFQRLEDDRLEKQAGRLSAWLQTISDNAVLDSAVYGVRETAEQQLEVVFYYEHRWWPVSNDDVVIPRFDEETTFFTTEMVSNNTSSRKQLINKAASRSVATTTQRRWQPFFSERLLKNSRLKNSLSTKANFKEEQAVPPRIVFLPTGLSIPEAFQLRADGRVATIDIDDNGLLVWLVESIQ